MYLCQLCRTDNIFRISIRVKTGDIIGDCAGKKRNFLGKITDILPGYGFILLTEICPVEPDSSPPGRPQPGE